jgi:DNA helicase II / ATP-dependent DNA helicase PcrA
MAYLRSVVAPKDEIALRRIINYPPRGIGRTTVLRLADLARDRRIPFGTLLATVSVADAGAGPAAAVHAFQHLLETARMELRGAETAATLPPPQGALPPLAAWAKGYFERLGIEDAIRRERGTEKMAVARVANVRDLVGTIARYERIVWDEAGSADWEPPSLSGALARLTLAEMDNTDDEPDTELGGVTLMTLHSAKGLEFSDVFIVGLEEGIVPHARSLAAEDGGSVAGDPLAEERRLLYVGITRACQRLSLSYCTSRRRNGATDTVLPSRYLDEIPSDLVEVRQNGATSLSVEESGELRKNFFSSMKDMLAE